MDVHSLPRKASDFQQPLSNDDLGAVYKQAFPSGPTMTAAHELSGGRYNTTYRLDRLNASPLILRVAPDQLFQSRLEHQLIRNEYTSIPLLAAVSHLMPVVIRADFTQKTIKRDYLIQSYLPGVPAAQALKQYTGEQQLNFWFQLGTILADIHSQTGSHFGPVNGDQYERWSGSLKSTFHAIASDMADADLDAVDILSVLQVIDVHQEKIDECSEPRLLHGDLWVGNVMLEPDSPTPRIVGIFDCDRTTWGDPESDWTLFLLARRSTEVQQAFRHGYGSEPETSPNATLRALVYRARSIAEARLEYRRMGEEEHVQQTYNEMKEVLAHVV